MTGNTPDRILHAAPGSGVAVHDDPAVWGPRLRRLVSAQRELCGRLEALAEQQTALIGDDQTDGLLHVLAERQGVLDELTALNEQVLPYRTLWVTQASRLPADERAQLQSLVDDMTACVERVAARDEADRVTLEEKRAAIAGELGSVSRGRGAIAAYGADASRRAAMGPRYQDREG